MKKTIALLLTLAAVIALAGCGGTSRSARRANMPARDYTLGAPYGGHVHDRAGEPRLPFTRDGGYVRRSRMGADGTTNRPGDTDAGIINRLTLDDSALNNNQSVAVPGSHARVLTPRAAQNGIQTPANNGPTDTSRNRQGKNQPDKTLRDQNKARTHKAS